MSTPIETEYKGYQISIEDNPDQYRGGYIWSVSDDDGELESDIEFTPEAALSAAKQTIDDL